MGLFDSLKKFFLGSPEKHRRQSTLLPGQEPLMDQLQQSAMGPGAGGAFGNAADYWYNILNDNPELMQQFMAPEMRRFNEQIIPGLSEQFAGMGAGGLSSSGFRNSAVNAGTDLQERLGALRAGLKNQAAQGLFGVGQQGLGNYSQDIMTQPGTQGLLPSLAEGAGNALTQFGGGFFNQAGRNMYKSNFGKSSPYGRQ